MKSHEQNRPADQDFIKQLNQVQHLVVKNFFLGRIAFGPREDGGHGRVGKTGGPVAGQDLSFGPVGVDSAGSELGRRRRMTDLHPALVAAGLDAVEHMKR